jgi:hypothetical protein
LIAAAPAYFTFGRVAFGASLVASIVLMIAFTGWAVVTERVNCQVAKRTVADNGARWEYSHLLHFMLPFCAFVSSVVAALMHAQQA